MEMAPHLPAAVHIQQVLDVEEVQVDVLCRCPAKPFNPRQPCAGWSSDLLAFSGIKGTIPRNALNH